MAKLSLQVDGMHCGACVRRVMQAVNGVPATHADEVRVGSARLTTQAEPQAVLEAIAKAGFAAHVTSQEP